MAERVEIHVPGEEVSKYPVRGHSSSRRGVMRAGPGFFSTLVGIDKSTFIIFDTETNPGKPTHFCFLSVIYCEPGDLNVDNTKPKASQTPAEISEVP